MDVVVANSLSASISVLTNDTEFSGTLLVEITRGCPFKCRFCTVGYVYPKFRQLPGDLVLELVAAQQQRDRAMIGAVEVEAVPHELAGGQRGLCGHTIQACP